MSNSAKPDVSSLPHHAGSLARLLPTSALGPRWGVWGCWGAWMLVHPLLFLFAPGLLAAGGLGLISPTLWGVFITLAAVPLLLLDDLTAPTEERGVARGGAQRKRRLWRDRLSPLLALPLLSLIATWLITTPGLSRGPMGHLFAAAVGSLGAAYLSWSLLRRVIDSLASTRDITRLHRRSARLVKQTARALLDELYSVEDDLIEAAHEQTEQTFELRAPTSRGIHLLTTLHGLELRIYANAVSLYAQRGHLPRNRREDLTPLLNKGVALEYHAPHALTLTLTQPDARRALGRAAAVIAAGWSRRERNRGAAPPIEHATDAPPTRTLGATQFKDWARRHGVGPSVNLARRVTASLLMIASGWLFAGLMLIFPTWEGHLVWWPSLLAVAIAVCIIHPLKLPLRRGMSSTHAIIKGSMFEVLNLFAAIRLPTNALKIETPTEPRTLGQFAHEGAALCVTFDAPGYRGSLHIRPENIGASGLVITETLTLEFPPPSSDEQSAALAIPQRDHDDHDDHDDHEDHEDHEDHDERSPEAAAIDTLQGLLKSHRSPFLRRDHEDGRWSLQLHTRRAIGSGFGAWAHLAWTAIGDHVLLGLEDTSPSLLSPPSVREPDALMVLQLARRPVGFKQLLALCALVVGLLALPRVGAEQYPVGVHPQRSLIVDPTIAGLEGSSGDLAGDCPSVEGDSTRALVALRCLANAAGQRETLDALNWTELLRPVSEGVEALDQITRARAELRCETIGERLSTLFETQQVMFTFATLERYHHKTWKALNFYWPDSLMQRGRKLRWSGAGGESVDAMARRCPVAIDEDTLKALRTLYQLSEQTFGGHFEKEDD